MKKIVLASFALLAVLAGANSCSLDEPQAGSDSRIEFVIPEFEPDDAATKVTTAVSGSSISSTWDAGDKIGVFPDMGGDQVSFTVSAGAGTGTCSFDGHGWALVSAAKYSAYYPFSKENYGDANAYKNVKVSYLGQAQTEKGVFSVGGFDFLACTGAEPVFDNPARPGGLCTFNFSHLGGLIILDVTFPQAAYVSTLELEYEEALFPQAGYVDLSQDTPVFTATAMGNSLTLDLGEMSVSANETVRFYMMCAPANMLSEKATVKATTSTGTVMSKQLSGSKNLKAGKTWSISTTLVASTTPVATLKATPAAFYPGYAANDITFRVKATEQYTMTTSVDWLTLVSSNSIDANTTEYTYRTTINNTSSLRKGNITITGATKSAVVKVEQDGLTLTPPVAGDGRTIYTTTGNYKYRYGPSIIMNDNGTIDAWFSAPGTLGSRSGMADVFTWQRTSDGGQSWTAEQVVLEGTKGKLDEWSVCDPGAAYFDGYYYMGYTSTTNTSSSSGLQGLENDLFIARSTSPSGPWQKWSGSGWGSNPQPVIEYDNAVSGAWGVGEPSIVVKDNTIYLYYTYDAGGTAVTKVATAPRNNANWPGSLTLHGTAVDKAALAESEGASSAGLAHSYDSCDVKYVEDYDLFYAFHTSWRITYNSRLSVWTSTDGLTFTYLGDVTGNVIRYAHNMGVSGDGLGHVNLGRTQYVSYGFSPADATDRSHGAWSTYWSTLTY
ncbi:MAG: hypothetical protein IJS30_04775 [Bacteroidales bacterium]|nr:hypothetical protein [Bacteroidales bacterium]